MKPVLYFLLAANLLVGVLGWLDYRQVKWVPVYEKAEGVAKLLLLSDSRGLQDVEPSSDHCWLLGPYSDRDEASGLRSRLVHIDYQASLLEKEIEKAPGYWVYYGPLPSRELAREKLKEFEKKNIDSFLITKPELENAISLGVFENIDSARRMIKLIEERGYRSKISEISKLESEFWVSLSIPPSERLQAAFEQFLSQEKHQLEARQIFCK